MLVFAGSEMLTFVVLLFFNPQIKSMNYKQTPNMFSVMVMVYVLIQGSQLHNDKQEEQIKWTGIKRTERKRGTSTIEGTIETGPARGQPIPVLSAIQQMAAGRQATEHVIHIKHPGNLLCSRIWEFVFVVWLCN